MEIKSIDDLIRVRFEDRNVPLDISKIVDITTTDSYLICEEDAALSRISSIVLNHSKDNHNSHETKLNMLIILSQLAKNASEPSKAKLKLILVGVSTWFDKYVNRLEMDQVGAPLDKSMHKSMLLLLTRVFDYNIKTEDLLELTNFNRSSALIIIVSLIEEANTNESVYELPFLLQLCRFLRGFSIPNAYFSHIQTESRESSPSSKTNSSLSSFNINEFSTVIESLLVLTMQCNLLEKLTNLLSRALFGECTNRARTSAQGTTLSIKLLDSEEHAAVIAINSFCHNLFLYGEGDSVMKYQKYILTDTSLVSRLILPYLERCVLEARLLDPHAQRISPARDRDRGEGKTDTISPLSAARNLRGSRHPIPRSPLARGVAASLKTLVMATFRCASEIQQQVMPHLSPANSLLRSASMLLYKHPEVLSLLCLLNVNMNTMDTRSRSDSEQNAQIEEENVLTAFRAHSLLKDIAFAFDNIATADKELVTSYIVNDKHGLPISRDMASYGALLAVLQGEKDDDVDAVTVSPYGRRMSRRRGAKEDSDDIDSDDSDDIGRAEAKSAVKDRLRKYKSNVPNNEQHQERQEEYEKSQSSAANESFSRHNCRHETGASGREVDALIALPKHEAKASSTYRLLGDLPSLSPSKTAAPFDLSLPSSSSQNPKKLLTSLKTPPKQQPHHGTGEVPAHLCCSINGHVMRDPVRSPAGHVFERSTIELWLKTRGSMCPCSGVPLKEEDLVADSELRTQIMRWQIQKNCEGGIENSEDDLYDF